LSVLSTNNKRVAELFTIYDYQESLTTTNYQISENHYNVSY